MEGQEGYLNKRIKVFYDDLGHISRKDGLCTAVSEIEVVLDSKIAIPRTRIVRIEVA